MISHHPRRRSRQRGVVLIAALLLLVVMSILAMTMFRTNGVQELIAGNVREKQRALQTAIDAETYAELILSNMGNVKTDALYANCTSVGLVAYTNNLPSFCLQTLATLTGVTPVGMAPVTVPWYNTNIANAEVGFTFYPGSAGGNDQLLISTTPSFSSTKGASLYQVPRLFIAYLGQVANAAYYQVDAWNYAGTTNTAAVVEGTYVVTCTTACGAPTL